MISRLVSLSSRLTSFNKLIYNSIRCMSENVTGPIMGIDLGTTNSCVAVMEGHDPRVIVNAEGHRTTPSVVAFTEDSQVLVGEPAKRQAVTNSKNTVYGTKRLIGRTFDDPEVQQELKHLPFQLVKSKTGNCHVLARGKDYSPSQIGSYVLSKMRETASSYLGVDCKNAVITVPAYFNDSQRQATKDAGTIAGLNVVRIINEPTAAALAYGLNKVNMKKTIAVFDLGGGTFDISILEINDGVFEVKSTNGDTRLGGEDFDNTILKYLVGEINKALRVDVTQDLKALQRIREAAEKLKIELSHTHETEVNLPYILGTNSYSCKIRRPQLEDLVISLINRTIPPCAAALNDAKLKVSQLDEVILVGGMTRMPKVQQTVKEFFKREPSKGVNPDEAVAMGAAVQGGVLTGSVSGILLVDVTPYSLGVETMGGVFSPIIERNSIIPTRKSQIYTTAEHNQTQVKIAVFQGDRGFCADNFKLGEFMLGPFPARPKGASQIEVSFELDNNGIVKVHATDSESGVKKEATVKSNPGGLTKAELERMSKEAEKYRAEDERRKETAMAKTELESTYSDAKRFVETEATKLSTEDVTKFREYLSTVDKLLVDNKEHSSEEYRAEMHKLVNELVKIKKLVEDNPSTESNTQASNTETKSE